VTDFADIRHFLERTERGAQASADDIASLRTAVPFEWPADYLACLMWSNGLEGYVGGHGYLWLWGTADIPVMNAAYHVPEFAPGLVLIGTDVAGCGYGYDTRGSNGSIFEVELSGLCWDYGRQRAASFAEFVAQLAAEPLPEGVEEPTDWTPPDWLRGHVIYQKSPIVLGGNPTDSENRVLVPRDKHPELAVFWSRVVQDAQSRRGGNRDGDDGRAVERGDAPDGALS
jgi:hypothetical protein